MIQKCNLLGHKFTEFERHNNLLIRACGRKGCVHVEQALMNNEVEPEELTSSTETNYWHPKLGWNAL